MAAERGRSGRRSYFTACGRGIALALILAAPAVRPAAAEPRAIEGSIEIAAPLELVWGVLTDFRTWPHFVPGLKRIAVVSQQADELALRHETESVGMAIVFTARMQVHPDQYRVDLVLDEEASNDLAAMRASWKLTSLDSGRVRVDFRSSVDSGQPIPGFIERRLLRTSVAETIESFSSEVERRVAAPGRS